jgi:DNA-binding MarR family transcriptional regulator
MDLLTPSQPNHLARKYRISYDHSLLRQIIDIIERNRLTLMRQHSGKKGARPSTGGSNGPCARAAGPHPCGLDQREQRFWRLYLDTKRALEAALSSELLLHSGLSAAEFAVLVPLSESRDSCVRARDLCRDLGWHRSRLSHLVARMERRGFVVRVASADDARGSVIALTAEGRRAITDAAPAYTAAVRRYLIDLLDEQQMTVMAAAFRRVLGALPPR